MTISTSTYLQSKIIDVTLRYSSFSRLHDIPTYIALYRADPTKEDVAVELSGSGYKRQPYIVTDSTIWSGSAWNSTAIVFPTASASWAGNVTHLGIRSGSETGANSGSLLFFGALSSPALVKEGETFIISTGSLKVSLGGAYRQYISSDILSNLLVNNSSRIGGPNYGAQKYIALFHYDWNEPPSSAPGIHYTAPTGAELSATGYTRVLAGNWSSASVSGSSHNLSNIVFTISAPSDWGEVKAIGITDSISNNYFYYVDALSSSATVLIGDTFLIESGSIIVQVT